MKIPTLKRQKNDPVIPIDYRDPTELGNIRGAAVRKINGRFNYIVKQLRKYVRENIKPTASHRVNSQLNRYRVTGITDLDNHDKLVANASIFDYLFGETQYSSLMDFLDSLFNQTLLSNSITKAWDNSWWFNDYIRRANEKALKDLLTSARYQTTAQTAGKELASTVRDMKIEYFTNSLPYQSGMKLKQLAAYSEMNNLVEGLKPQLAEILRQGTREGVSQKELISRVTKRLISSDNKGEGQARRKARLLVRNRINNARREASRDFIGQLNDDTYADSGMEMRQLWFSALMPNRTRPWHGSRHGKIYTTKEVETFYAEPGNSANCYCHQTPILVYSKTGKPVTDTKLYDRMKKQKEIFMTTAR